MNRKIPHWVESAEGKLGFMHTRGKGGERVGRGVRKIEKCEFGWAAITPDKCDVIDLSLADDPLFWPVEAESPADALERHERAISIENAINS
jgi:hypothetical protein